MTDGIRLCVVIPFYNAERYLTDDYRAFLSSLQQAPHIQTVFYDSSSSDNTRERLAEFGLRDITVIPQHEFDHGGTRTRAAKRCQADVVVFLTQDARPVSLADIERLVAVFENPAIAAAFGRQLPHPDARFFARHLRQFNYPETSYVRTWSDRLQFGLKAAFLSNSFAAYRCSAMNDIDWFPEGILLGEDSYAGAKLLQAGYALAYVAEAQAHHSHNYSIVQEFQRYFDIGAFHQMQASVLAPFGKAEGEGRRYLMSEWGLLRQERRYDLLPAFVARNAMKYLGYRLGKGHRRLPMFLIKKFSMHPQWWQNRLNTD